MSISPVAVACTVAVILQLISFQLLGFIFFWYSYGMDLYISKHISRENAHLERKFTMKIDVIS